MQSALKPGSRQKRKSTAAQKAVSPGRVRRRRQEQTRRRFGAALRATQAFFVRSGRLVSDFVWRRGQQASSRRRAATSQGSIQPYRGDARATPWPGFSGFAPAKGISLLLLAAVAAALYWMLAGESFFIYREDVRFEGARYLTHEELFDACEIESWSIFWLDPAEIQKKLLAYPYVADAQVTVGWPARVDVRVQEVRPVALWATDEQQFWLLEGGLALAPRESDQQPTVRIIDPSAEARVANVDGELLIDNRVMTTAMVLSDRLSFVNEFWYNSLYGLNFSLPSTQVWVHWGDGRNFEEKWAALQELMPELTAARDEAVTLNLETPNRPFTRRYKDAESEQ